MTGLDSRLPEEEARGAVRHALSLIGEARFAPLERVVSMTSRLLGVDSAGVLLVSHDDRGWIAGRGLVPSATADLPSLHEWILDHPDGVAVDTPNMAACAEAAGWASWASAPLKVAGYRVGVLVAASASPVEWTVAQCEDLADLSAWAGAAVRAEGTRRLVAELAAVSERMHAIVDNVAEGIVGLDHSGHCQYINPAGAAILGWEESDLVGEVFHDAVHHSRPDGSPYPMDECPLMAVLSGGQSVTDIRESFLHREGHAVSVECSVGAVHQEDGTIGAAVVFSDVTAKGEWDEMRRRFLSTVSHEMRTPLTSLLGALRIVDSGALGKITGDVAGMLEIAVRNGARLSRLIDDVVDTERIDAGAFQLARARLSLVRLATEAATTVRGIAAEAGVTVIVDGDDGEVWGDGHRLVQVLTNLAGNAVRFSPAGGTVSITTANHADHAEIVVTDEGPGIAPEAVERIFEPFWQADASDTRSHSGSGLGLSIARGIVAGHGGTIEVDSTVGVGSSFIVTLPIRAHVHEVAVERRRTPEEGRP